MAGHETGNNHRSGGGVLLRRMWDRVDTTRSESETALFYDLLFFGELICKLVVLAQASAVGITQERHHYRVHHRLVRADGVGEWSTVLDDLLTGPASAHIHSDAVAASRELTQRFASGDDAWQYEAVAKLQSVCACLEPTRLPSQGKVALKTWFSDFAWLRNRTRGHGAPKPTTCHAVVPDLEASIRLIADNAAVFSRGWAHLRQNLTGKYRVSPLAGDVDAFMPLKSRNDLNLQDGVYVALGSELFRVHLLETDADLTDIYVANGAFGERSGALRYESLSYYTDATRDADGSPWESLPNELPPSETQPQPGMDLVGGSFSNMPSMARGYVERAQLESELLALLRDDRHPVVTLVGRGGIGKTSLALSVLHELSSSADFFSICWFSARDLDLLASGPKPVRPDVLSVEEIATKFADLMVPEWRRSDHHQPLDLLARALSGEFMPEERLLFVFDNFETVRNPRELYAFVDQSVRTPNKVLITSRFRDFRGDYPVPVGGMERPQFAQLVDSTASQLEISGLLTPQYRDSLFEEADGHPYVAKVLLGELARTRVAGSVERVMAAQDDVLNALFERTFNAIPASAQRVFLTLSNWRSVVPRLALEAALLRPANERMNVAEALEVLEQSSLVEILKTDELDGEFVRVPLAAYMFGQRKLRVSPSKAAVEADTEIIRLFGAAHRSEVGRGLRPRVHRMLSAIAKRKAESIDVTDELAVLDYLARKYAPARLLMADYYTDEGRRTDAIDAVSAYLETTPSDLVAWQRLADLYRAENDGRGEVFATFEAARLGEAALSDISNAADTLNRHNFHNSSGLEPDESRSMAEELVSLMSASEEECTAVDFSRLAWLLLHLGRQADARRAVGLGLDKDPSNRYCVKLASNMGLAS